MNILMGCLLKDSLKAVVEHRVLGLYVFEDSSYADEKLYNCIKNTILQVYDCEKSEQIKTLFTNHFATERFMETFGIEK